MTGMVKTSKEKEQLNLLLEEAALSGREAAGRYPGRRFFGYFCSYWPEELVLAAGLEPLRMLPASSRGAPAALPVYCCSLAKDTLSLAAEGKFNNLAGVGFAHTCDTMQCLGGIWGETAGQAVTLVLVPPVRLDAPGALAYFKAELAALLQRLAGLTGHQPGGEDLHRALALCEHIRRLAARLDEMRSLLPSPLVAALLRAGQVMPRADFARALETALPALQEQAADPGDKRRVLVSGAVLENDDLFRSIEELGGRVVADDTCTGYRHFTGSYAGGKDDPLAAIARRYIAMPPCPCRHRGLDARPDHLEKLARARQAHGVILVTRKYCEPHAWDAVPLSQRLRGAGLHVLVLELEGAEIGGQERTRLQAFLESF